MPHFQKHVITHLGLKKNRNSHAFCTLLAQAQPATELADEFTMEFATGVMLDLVLIAI
ncbi:hypothetical protein [Undibacterium sp. Ji22W]|uniref:hypothetical protein n=1 Tax=Undibacterium sp. Ji22W TaxID=3413038 RepID=UPI003BEF67F6